jgi:exosortase
VQTLEQQPLVIPTAPSANKWKAGLPLVAFSILWIDLIRQLSYTWSTNEQYAYGWFVPILALALFIKKWPTRPQQSSVVSGPVVSSPVVSGQWSVVSSPPFLLSAFCFLLLVALLPLRVIHEINQDWALITWPLTGAAVAVSLYAVYLAGGWRWVKHFVFPVCFILVAVRWPYRIEHGLTQNLMQIVANITVEVLGWLDIPALQRGNLIELSTGVLGVDEACSGIRSFQSTLMAALFLGELYPLRWPIRVLLAAIGLSAAFLFNITRTLILAWQANKHGLSAVDKWHDPAGMTIAIACFFLIWLLALRLRRSSPVLSSPMVSGPVINSPVVSSQWSVVSKFLAALGLWALICIGVTETWYRSHQLQRADAAQWWVSYPTNLPSFQPATVSKAAAKLLRHDAESGGSWEEPDGTKWSVFCFRWKEGDPTARMSAMGHRPEYCLVGSGHDLRAMSGVQYLSASGIELPFRLYTFDSENRPLHVFFCLWEDGAEKQAGFGKTKTGDRLRTVIAGRRGMGQQTLEIICTGYPEMETAEKAVRKRLPDIIHPGTAAVL